MKYLLLDPSRQMRTSKRHLGYEPLSFKRKLFALYKNAFLEILHLHLELD